MNKVICGRKMAVRGIGSVLMLSVGAGLAGCETKAGTGALIGGATGAGLGAIIGHNSHGRTAGGALIGGAVGAVAGGLIGNEMDKNDKKQQREVDDAYHAGRADGGGGTYTEVRETRVIRRGRDLTADDVISMSNRGMRETEILDAVDHSGTDFRLTAADEDRLHAAGVSDTVIREMRMSNRQGDAR